MNQGSPSLRAGWKLVKHRYAVAQVKVRDQSRGLRVTMPRRADMTYAGLDREGVAQCRQRIDKLRPGKSRTVDQNVIRHLRPP